MSDEDHPTNSEDQAALASGDVQQAAVAVPHRSLSAEALQALIEEFVTRHGTDYGLHEKSLQEKVQDVMRKLETGEASVVFDPKTETANIVMSDSIT